MPRENQDRRTGEGEGEGTLATSALEKRNTERSKSADVIFDIESVENLHHHQEEGISLNETFEQHYEKMNKLLTKFIIVAGLVMITVFLWRIELLLTLAEAVL